MVIEAIIFDCDGTLVDSLPLATEVLVEYLADLGVTLSESEATARFGSGRLAESVAELERSFGLQLPTDFVPELRRRRDAAVRTRLRPIDGASELLRGLRIPIAVASNGPLEQTRLSLEVTGSCATSPPMYSVRTTSTRGSQTQGSFFTRRRSWASILGGARSWKTPSPVLKPASLPA